MRKLRKYVASTVVAAMMLAITLPAFAAVSAPATSADALYDLGLYKGTSTTSFNPDLASQLTRETAATLVVRMAGQEKQANALSDVAAKEIINGAGITDTNSIATWALGHVAIAVQDGVIQGFPDKTFKPQEKLSGQQLMAMFMQKLGYTNFQFATVVEEFGTVAGLTSAEKTLLGNPSMITKAEVVAVSEAALKSVIKGTSKTLLTKLVEDGAVVRSVAEANSVFKAFVAAAVPTSTPTPSVAGVTYSNVTVTAQMVGTSSVAKGQALFEVGKLTFTALSDSKISGIKLTRSGLSKDDDVSSITVWDGSTRLNTAAIFSNNVAEIPFINALDVKKDAPKTVSIRLNFATDATTGSQVVVSMATGDVKTVDAGGSVTGAYPFTSGALTLSQVSLGELEVTIPSDAPADNSTVDAGVAVRLAKFKIVASNEAIALNRIIFTQDSSVSDSDLANLKLYNGSTLLAEGVQLVNRKAVFELASPLEIAQGGTVYLELKGDIVSGSSRIIQFGIDDVNDIQATGKTYGTTIVSDVTLIGNKLTINPGSVLMSKDMTSPASGTVGSTANDKVFTILKLQAVGEPIRITKMRIASETGGAYNYQLTDVKVWNGDAIAGQNQTPFGTAAADNVTTPVNLTLTSPITINPGTPVLVKVSADLTSVAEGRTYALGISSSNAADPDVANAITFTQVLSGKTDKLAGSSKIIGGVMTVGTVAMTPAFVPAATNNVFSGQSDVTLGTIKLNHNLSESVNITNLNVNFDLGGTVATTDIRNLRLVDESGTVISDTKATISDPQTLTFTNPITIAQDAYKNVKIVADLATTTHTGTVKVFLNNEASTPKGGTATTTANGTDVTFGALVLAGASTNNLSVGGSAFEVTRSVAQDIGDGNIYKSQTNKKIAGYRFESTANGVEAASVKKMYIAPVVSGTSESRTITVAGGAPTADGTVAIILNGAAAVTVTYNHLVNYDASVDNVAGTSSDLAACIAAAYYPGYGVSRSGAVVTFTAVAVGDQVGAFSATPTGLNAATTTVGGVVNGTAASSPDLTLGNEYIKNIRIVDAVDNSKILATVGTLNGPTNVTLSTPFEVPAYADASSYEITVLADVTSDAPAGLEYGVRLGNGTASDIEYSPKTTAGTQYKASLNVKAGNGTDAKFVTGLSKIVLANSTLANPNPSNGAGAVIGRFTVTNSGTSPVSLYQIELDDLNTATGLGGSKSATIQLFEGSTPLNTTPVTFDGTTEQITLNNEVLLSIGESKTIVVKLSTVGLTVADNPATPLVNETDVPIANGTSINLKVESTGTLYDSTSNSGYQLPVDGDAILDTVTMKNPAV